MPRFVRFDECPPGLFLWAGHLNLMTEYSQASTRGERLRLAYVCASGEMFWGGTSFVSDRNALKVQPIPRSALDAVAGVLKRDLDRAALGEA